MHATIIPCNAIARDAIGQCSSTSCSPFNPLLPTLDVSVDIEVGEEDNKGDGVPNEGIVHPLGEVAVNVEGVHSMDDG